MFFYIALYYVAALLLASRSRRFVRGRLHLHLVSEKVGYDMIE